MQPFTFFISYRRDDTAPIALLLKSEIERRLRFVRVWVDIDDPRPGEPLSARVQQSIDSSHATIALIGRQWMPQAGKTLASDPTTDRLVDELVYSNEAPLALPQDERFGQGRRLLVPLFADCAPDLRQFSLPRRLEFLARLEPEQIGFADWSRMIGPLLDRIAVRLSLKDHPDADAYPEPDPANARTQALGDDELARTLRFDDFEGWYVDSFGHADARYLVKAFMFRDFDQAVDFMARVSEHCRVLDHHPEWRNVFNQVSVSLTTWDAHRRVTLYDLELALFMNRVAKTIAQARQGAA